MPQKKSACTAVTNGGIGQCVKNLLISRAHKADDDANDDEAEPAEDIISFEYNQRIEFVVYCIKHPGMSQLPLIYIYIYIYIYMNLLNIYNGLCAAYRGVLWP